MTMTDTDRDLVLERVVPVPRRLMWEAWTQPHHLKQWWTPAPYVTIECEIDLQPGGVFRTVMRSPEGVESENLGCYLDVVEGKRLVWTTMLGPGFRPTDDPMFPFTAVIELEDDGEGTRYRATAMHPTARTAARHAEMGFHDGWSTVLDQLVALFV